MNRENKRKQYEKSYYKTHACADSFTCKVCGRLVVPAGAGTGHRNHCPNCLCSLHLDVEPGDRQADCGGIMEPVGVWVRKNSEWAIIHRCRRCGRRQHVEEPVGQGQGTARRRHRFRTSRRDRGRPLHLLSRGPRRRSRQQTHRAYRCFRRA